MKTHLIIDLNFFLISRAYIHRLDIHQDLPLSIQEIGIQKLFNTIDTHIHQIATQKTNTTHIHLVTDAGSWRKNLPQPQSLSGEYYKGNRDRSKLGTDFKPDWNYLFTCYNQWIKEKHPDLIYNDWNVEGDDWAFGISSTVSPEDYIILYTKDEDWKQILHIHPNGEWNNGKLRVRSIQYNQKKTPVKPGLQLNIFQDRSNFQHTEQIEYIDPKNIIQEKIIFGDKSDNILPIWFEINPNTGKKVNITEKMMEPSKFRLIPVSDFYQDPVLEKLSKYISHLPKFSGAPVSEIIERLKYNRTLVHLDWGNYPIDIKDKMIRRLNNGGTLGLPVSQFEITPLPTTQPDVNIDLPF